MLVVENLFVRQLPGEIETQNFRRQVQHACYSWVKPKTPIRPQLIAYSRDLAEQLGLTSTYSQSDSFVNHFSGASLPDKSQPFAMCYGGHQFGNWAGQLGDGRAINLGELKDRNGKLQSLQLKGAGPTPYSRSADGLAVLRSSIREFLCSEAMFHLGVPTTRALSVIATGEQVLRDMLYDGHPEYEPGAVVCRVAPSFIRFGNFEIHAARQETDILRRLADYTIEQYFPDISGKGADKYLQWFAKVSDLTCDMIVHWMRVGFVHGVMNTDNMSIHGLTIDYGPYGWLDNFDPDWTPNTTDAQGRRYRYGNQPAIAQWNLLQLANALFPLINQVQPLQTIVEDFAARYQNRWRAMMAAKLGLMQFQQNDEDLIGRLVSLMQKHETDMTLFFRRLGQFSADVEMHEKGLAFFSDCFYGDIKSQKHGEWLDWLQSYSDRIQQDDQSPTDRREAMENVNPVYVLRNYLAQEAIDKAHEGDYSLVKQLLNLMQHAYTEQNGMERFAQKRPDWARHKVGCSMLSCSS